jgi:hypothetical protein
MVIDESSTGLWLEGSHMSFTAASCHHHWMIKPLAGKPQTGLNVLWFEIRQFFQHLGRSQAVGEEVEHIGHAEPHATNAWTPSTLLWITRDAFSQLGHEFPPLACPISTSLRSSMESCRLMVIDSRPQGYG